LKTISNSTVNDVRTRLIEVGGRTSQDLGLGRIVGQILVYLYLHDGECSLDQIGHDLGLSKAAVSIAARQLESLGLLRRAWKKGERKTYYRTTEDMATALQQGLLAFLGQKIQAVAGELDYVNEKLEEAVNSPDVTPETQFVYSRVKRAKVLRDRVAGLLDNPIVKFFVKS
jgi:DNA-binding transcriptional regulator GbsR (MarR family)